MPKHLNTSELFSSNPGDLLQRSDLRTDYQSDSAINSSQSFTSSAANSQMMASQMDNSQSSSFDMFSQMMSQQQGFSQQNETSSNFYVKYMSKPPLFQRENASKKTSLPRRKSFQGMQEFNKERAKERDDRDLINTFIALVKECADEVRTAASSIKKDVNSNIAETTKQTAAAISKISSELSSHHKQLLDSLKVHGDHEKKIQELLETIASKDAQIQMLESELTRTKQDRNEHLLKAMLDMYTSQQSITRQHLNKVHEEQHNIKEQQNKIHAELEKSHTTLTKIAVHPVQRNAVDVEGNCVTMATNRDHSIPAPPLPSRAAMPMEICTSIPNLCAGQVNGATAGRETWRAGMPPVASHLFHNQLPSSQPTDQYVSLSNYNQVQQYYLRQDSVSHPQEPAHQQWSMNPAPPLDQRGNTRNAIQDSTTVAMPRSNSQQRPSCRDHFANKFSSPNYTGSSKQMWSKKNLKPSPVAAVLPQMHHESSDGSQQNVHEERSCTGSGNNARKSTTVRAQPQRKSARLSAKGNFDDEREEVRSPEADIGHKSRKSIPRRKKKKSKQQAYCNRSPESSQSSQSSQDDEYENMKEFSSGREKYAVCQKENNPSTKKASAQSHQPIQRRGAKAVPVQEHSSNYSTKPVGKPSRVYTQQDSSDEDDEYSFHDDAEILPAKPVSKTMWTPMRHLSSNGESNHVKEVFTARSVTTYSKPKKTTPAFLQGPTVKHKEQLTTSAKRKGEQESKITEPPAKKALMDVARIYTEDDGDDSSQELYFTLKLPETQDVCSSKSPKQFQWSSLMSPSVNSQYPEQVVPDHTSRGPGNRGGCSSSRITARSQDGGNINPMMKKKGMVHSRKRRMIYSSQDKLNDIHLEMPFR